MKCTYIEEIGFLKADEAGGQAPNGKHDDSEAAPLRVSESHLGHHHIKL